MIRCRWLLPAAIFSCILTGCIENRQEIGPEVKTRETVPAETGVRINTIMAEQEKYRGKKVTVSGKVMPGLAFEFISEQPYRIIQGESLLWVITRGTSPREGEFVTVKGTIASPYQIKGRSYQLALLEEERL
jgi:hypothetical protein